MRRNCNLELRLLPPTPASFVSSDYSTSSPSMLETLRGTPKEEQQLTIFYNGQIAVCDVTELRARAIISLASREMDEKSKTPSSSGQSSPAVQSPLYSPTPAGLTMKRSLQRFLHKRKNRIQATFPYHHR